MRGLYTATLLDSLSKALNPGRRVDIGSAFDVIAGTSTGGILATALAVGVPIEKVISLYREAGPGIFTDPQPSGSKRTTTNPRWLRKLLLPITILHSCWSFLTNKLVWWCIRNRNKPANSSAPLQEELTKLFGDLTFGKLYEDRQIGLCITAVKILDEQLRVFKTPHIPSKTWDVNLKLVHACMATSAAPLFLPLAAVPSTMTPDLKEMYADGGLAANNPVLIGLIEALQLIGSSNREIQIFSAGTCCAPEGDVIGNEDLNRGLLQWQAGAKALGLSMNAQASAANYAAQFLADWFTKYTHNKVTVVRFPESQRSEAHLQYLRMDNATPECLSAFMAFGNDDAMKAKSHCDQGDSTGLLIKGVFSSMSDLKN
jgi:uncharacterized protein